MFWKKPQQSTVPIIRDFYCVDEKTSDIIDLLTPSPPDERKALREDWDKTPCKDTEMKQKLTKMLDFVDSLFEERWRRFVGKAD